MKSTSKIWLRNQISSNWKALPDKVPFRSTFYDRVVGMVPDMIQTRKPKNIKHKRVVSISLYLPEKVWVEMSKTQHFETYENCIFVTLARQTWNIWAELLNWVVEVIKSEKHFENLVDKSDSIQLKSTSRQGALPVDLLRQSGWNGSRHDTDQKAKKHKTQKSGFH